MDEHIDYPLLNRRERPRGIYVDSLAALVNMSPSAFHRAFNDVTASSPIQYSNGASLWTIATEKPKVLVGREHQSDRYSAAGQTSAEKLC